MRRAAGFRDNSEAPSQARALVSFWGGLVARRSRPNAWREWEGLQLEIQGPLSVNIQRRVQQLRKRHPQTVRCWFAADAFSAKQQVAAIPTDARRDRLSTGHQAIIGWQHFD